MSRGVDATADLAVPGLDVAACTAEGSALDVQRMGANDWLVALLSGRSDVAGVRAASMAQFEPVMALQQIPTAAVALARVELDVCGAWVTLCCAGTPQPVVVRHAGWIDFRGQLTTPGARDLADDRVGLGPGDCIVLLGPELLAPRDEQGEHFGAEGLPTGLLAACGAPTAQEVINELRRSLREFNGQSDVGPVIVLRVPLEAKEKSAQRVARATGLSAADLKTTRYPLGEQLMARRPAPPREARIELKAELSQIATARQLLSRLLQSWRMADETMGDVQLLASEITANAIQHGQSPVTLIARYDGQRVRVEVGDGSRELPQRRMPRANDEGGRGMFLVDAMAADWGVIPTLHGKRVWFEVELGQEPAPL